jgi:hypothetical protein
LRVFILIFLGGMVAYRFGFSQNKVSLFKWYTSV